MNEYAAVVSAVVAAVVSIVGVIVNRRQTLASAAAQEATAADVTVSTALELLNPLRERVRVLEDKVEEMCREIRSEREAMAELRDGVEVLTNQLIEAGHQPAWPE